MAELVAFLFSCIPLNLALYTAGLALLVAVFHYLLLPSNINSDTTVPGSETRPKGRDFPPVYPNGWIPVAESRDVVKGSIVPSKIFVNEIVLFRDATGVVCALDAFCPHLGAHLGHGGELTEDNGNTCIRCPFHGWEFRATDGSCVRVPYAQEEKPPAGAKVKSYEVIDSNGFVCVWYHSEGEKSSWLPSVVSEVEAGKWSFAGRTEELVNCHFQEIPENGADIAHLDVVHKSSILFGGRFGGWTNFKLVELFFGYHTWGALWTPSSPPEAHCADIKLKTQFNLFNKSFWTQDFTIKQVGPLMVTLKFTSVEFGGSEGVFVQAITPLDINKQKVVHHIYMKQDLKGKILAKMYLRGEGGMVKRDIRMWNNKKFLKNPLLVKEEKSIAKFRQWYKQFYSANSPRSFESTYEW